MKKKQPPSLLKLLTTRIFLLGVTTLASVVALSSILAYMYLIKEHESQLEIHSKNIKNEFNRLQGHALAEASLLSNRTDIISILAKKNKEGIARINKLLKRHIHTTDIDHIIATDTDGKLISSYPDFKTTKHSVENYLSSSVAVNRALAGLSGKSIEIYNNSLAVVTSMPVLLPASDYRIIGTITTMFHINKKFLSHVKNRIGHDIVIRAEDSLYVTTLEESKNELSDQNTYEEIDFLSQKNLKLSDTSFSWLSVADSKYMTAINRLTGEDNLKTNTHIMLLVNKNIIWKQIAAFILTLFISFIIIVSGFSAIAYKITRKITIPLKTVTDALILLSKGGHPTLNLSNTSLETMYLTTATENLATTLKRDKEEIAQAQLELIESEENLSALAENASDGIMILDKDKYLYCNVQAKELLGYESVNKLLDTTISDLVHPDEIETFLTSYINRADRENPQSQNEALFLKSNGTSFPAEYSLTNTTWEGNIVGLIFFRDISERKKIEHELNEHRHHLEELVEQRTLEFRQQAIELEHAMAIAEKANTAKSEFLSHMSHELRTPLNAIMGFGQLMDTEETNPLNENQKDMANEILNASRHLLDLINEVLDLSRIESGRLKVTTETLDISTTVSTCISQLQDSLAKTRGIEIKNLIKEDEIYVSADELRLRQVIINYISNAVKYNKEGGAISINCILKPHDIARIEVIDTGIGIPEDKLSKIFAPFERVNENSHSIEGTGIGLSVCKHLIEAMNGITGVESQVDKGSTFWFELPASEKREEENKISKDKNNISTLKNDKYKSNILCVEDNLKNQKLIKQILLRSYNTNVICATTGKEGLSLAKEDLPDLILMDINLPDISGIEVLKSLKTDATTKNIPVIAISAEAMPELINEYMNEGFYAYITKPIEISDLLKKIDLILNEQNKHKK